MAAPRETTKSITSTTTASSDTAEAAIPAIASRLPILTMRSLLPCRKRSRWYELGAVSSATETAVDRKATTNTSRWNVGDARPALREGDGEEEREQDRDAREHDAQLVQQLDQLAVGPLLRRLLLLRPVLVHPLDATAPRRFELKMCGEIAESTLTCGFQIA